MKSRALSCSKKLAQGLERKWSLDLPVVFIHAGFQRSFHGRMSTKNSNGSVPTDLQNQFITYLHPSAHFDWLTFYEKEMDGS